MISPTSDANRSVTAASGKSSRIPIKFREPQYLAEELASGRVLADMVSDLDGRWHMHAVELAQSGDEAGRVEEVEVADAEPRPPEGRVLAGRDEADVALPAVEGEEIKAGHPAA
jgi:hypothetical protein